MRTPRREGTVCEGEARELKNFTGIDSAYEPPESAEIDLRTTGLVPETCVDQIIKVLRV